MAHLLYTMTHKDPAGFCASARTTITALLADLLQATRPAVKARVDRAVCIFLYPRQIIDCKNTKLMSSDKPITCLAPATCDSTRHLVAMRGPKSTILSYLVKFKGQNVMQLSEKSVELLKANFRRQANSGGSIFG